MDENEKLKRESKRSASQPVQPKKEEAPIPDVEEMKSKFMDRLTS